MKKFQNFCEMRRIDEILGTLGLLGGAYLGSKILGKGAKALIGDKLSRSYETAEKYRLEAIRALKEYLQKLEASAGEDPSSSKYGNALEGVNQAIKILSNPSGFSQSGIGNVGQRQGQQKNQEWNMFKLKNPIRNIRWVNTYLPVFQKVLLGGKPLIPTTLDPRAPLHQLDIDQIKEWWKLVSDVVTSHGKNTLDPNDLEAILQQLIAKGEIRSVIT